MIKRLGGHEYIPYRNMGLPLVRLEDYVPVGPIPSDSTELYALLPKLADERAVGIAASRIIDTVELETPSHSGANLPPGFLGSAIVNGEMTMFLDLNELLNRFEKRSGRDCSGDEEELDEPQAVCNLQDR